MPEQKNPILLTAPLLDIMNDLMCATISTGKAQSADTEYIVKLQFPEGVRAFKLHLGFAAELVEATGA